MTERFLVVPAAYVVFRRGEASGAAGDDVGNPGDDVGNAAGGEVLLQLRQNTGFMDGHWAVAAAGHVEANETVLAAAGREAAEELGVRVEPQQLRTLCVMHRTGGNGRTIDERVDFFFECWQWSGTPRLVEPDKTADLRWFRLDALPEPVVPHERVVLDHVRSGTVPPLLTYGFRP